MTEIEIAVTEIKIVMEIVIEIEARAGIEIGMQRKVPSKKNRQRTSLAIGQCL